MGNVKFRQAKSIVDLGVIFRSLNPLLNLYPNFNEWYFNKFAPDVLLGNDVALMMFVKDEFVGTAMLKNQKEKKIRGLRIVEAYQKKGYGLYLIDESLKVLDEPLPHCTVAEEMINDYSRVFVNRYSFKLDYIERNKYRLGKNEYLFNL